MEQALSGLEIEVVAKATRRRFTLEYKRKIVREADGCKNPGGVGALLRREGLYCSHLATWRAAHDRGELAGAPKKRGPTPEVRDPRDNRIAELERDPGPGIRRDVRSGGLILPLSDRGPRPVTVPVRTSPRATLATAYLNTGRLLLDNTPLSRAPPDLVNGAPAPRPVGSAPPGSGATPVAIDRQGPPRPRSSGFFDDLQTGARSSMAMPSSVLSA